MTLVTCIEPEHVTQMIRAFEALRATFSSSASLGTALFKELYTK